MQYNYNRQVKNDKNKNNITLVYDKVLLLHYIHLKIL